ncbi:DNA replication/repair protein RecF, partial [Enterococcus faecalis]
VLKQRNQYLKQLAEKKQTDTVFLDILTEQLAEFGGKVLFARLGFLKKLEHWANLFHQKISHGRETLTIDYASSIPIDN